MHRWIGCLFPHCALTFWALDVSRTRSTKSSRLTAQGEVATPTHCWPRWLASHHVQAAGNRKPVQTVRPACESANKDQKQCEKLASCWNKSEFNCFSCPLAAIKWRGFGGWLHQRIYGLCKERQMGDAMKQQQSIHHWGIFYLLIWCFALFAVTKSYGAKWLPFSRIKS